MAAVFLLLCGAHAGPPAAPSPTSRCLLAAKPASVRAVAATGLPELDKRIRSECSFLKALFGVDPELVLMADGAPRLAFAVVREDGTGTVFVSASWLRRIWAGGHRVATVAAVLAHQYAHVLQGKRKCALPEWSREQQADLLAGWYLGKRNIATLGSGKDLDAVFAASLFASYDEFLNAPFDHGAPVVRAAAMRQGFDLFRDSRLKLDKVYAEGLDLFPPPNEGLASPEKPQGLLARVKIECRHKGPGEHEVPCQHPQPCIHKVECEHQLSCEHRIPCEHKVECQHHLPCDHRTECVHHVECVHRTPCVHRRPCEHWSPCCHRIPCTHTLHDCDYIYRDENGKDILWGRRVPCSHFRHDFDYEHDGHYEHCFDYEHEYDTEHTYDREHEYDTKHAFHLEHDFDMAHEFDTEHPFHLAHEFDMAHEWDPVHSYDFAHEWDLVHDYDVMFVPAEKAEGASGAE